MTKRFTVLAPFRQKLLVVAAQTHGNAGGFSRSGHADQDFVRDGFADQVNASRRIDKPRHGALAKGGNSFRRPTDLSQSNIVDRLQSQTFQELARGCI